ncbi:MAG: HlyD family secretion protein [Elusimicrobia bacterium]|nr:HlyD family secretion protein [Elusimicrobiota bacterium]
MEKTAGANGGKKRTLMIVGAVVLVPALILGVKYWRYYMSHASTDDAFIATDDVPIAPQVPGKIVAVYVSDNEKVKKGDPLLQIDPRDYQARLDQAQAEVASAQAQENKTSLDVRRYKDLAARDEASRQEYDHALAAYQQAKAQVELAQAGLEQARLNLSYTKISAPTDGHVSEKSAVAGMYVQTGQDLMAIVPNKLWVLANFKETEVTDMHPGQKVRITIDTYPGVVFHGHVNSIQRGTGAAFSLLPPENATGNFVKVVQRIPVKIVFDDAPNPTYPLAVGMSVEPTVDLR